MKQLPIIHSPIDAYPHQAALFSMLMGKPECLPWVYSNFIQMYSLRDLHLNKKRTGTLDFFYNLYGDWKYYELKTNPWLLMDATPLLLFNKYDIDIVDHIRACIDSEKYVFFDIDMYYIKSYAAYMKQHMPHDIFIYGYNDIDCLFYFGDNTEGKYHYRTCTYEELKTSVTNLIDLYVSGNEKYFIHAWREKLFYTFYIKQNTARNGQEKIFELDTKKISCEIKEYLLLTPYADKYIHSKFYVFGIDCYKEIFAFIDHANEHDYFVDYRALYSFMCHKKLMLMRIKYTAYLFEDCMNDYMLLIEGYEKVLSLFQQALFILIKANLLRRGEIFQGTNSALKQAMELELRILPEYCAFLDRES